MFSMVKFSAWLDEKLEEKGWTRAELSRRAGVSQSSLSMVYSGQRNIGPELASAIARAFDLPESTVFAAAELISPAAPGVAQVAELNHLLNLLDEENLREVIDYARMRLEKQEAAKQPKKQSSRSKRPARIH